MQGGIEPFVSNDLFSLLAGMPGAAVAVLDGSRSILFANNEFQAMTGTDSGSVTGTPLIRWLPVPEWPDPGGEVTGKLPLSHTDGDGIECEYRVKPLSGGTDGGFIVWARPIRQSLLIGAGERFLESLFAGGANLPDEMFVSRALGHAEEATDSRLALYYQIDPLSGRITDSFVSPSALHQIAEGANILKNRKSLKTGGFWDNCLKGRVPVTWKRGDSPSLVLPVGHLPVDSLLAVPLHEGPEPVGIIALANRPWPYREAETAFLVFYGRLLSRLLSRRRLFGELTDKGIRLETITRERDLQKNSGDAPEKTRSLFLSYLSHHIRNPMNGIMGFAELLEDDKLSVDDRRFYIGVIHENGRMLLDLLDSLLELSRVEAGQVVAVRAPVQISLILNQVATRYREGFQGRKPLIIKLANELPADLDRFVLDGDILRKALVAVINHARYQNGVESVELCSRPGPAGLILFEILWQTAETAETSDNGQGTSVEFGLAEGLVRLLSGRMQRNSLTARGSIVTLEIPGSRQDREPATEVLTPETMKGCWRGKRILIIEDDDISFQYLNAALRTTGVTIFRADNGTKGVRFVDENRDIDMVLLDIRLPEMDGIEAAGKILAIRRDLPLVAQTAYAFPEDRERCLAVGCIDVLTKPIHRDELFSVMKKWLG
jgi:CheY-like chemotaxis protein